MYAKHPSGADQWDIRAHAMLSCIIAIAATHAAAANLPPAPPTLDFVDEQTYAVIDVIAPDELIVDINGFDVAVKLAGIAAPESADPHANPATRFLRDLLLGEDVYLRRAERQRNTTRRSRDRARRSDVWSASPREVDAEALREPGPNDTNRADTPEAASSELARNAQRDIAREDSTAIASRRAPRDAEPPRFSARSDNSRERTSRRRGASRGTPTVFAFRVPDGLFINLELIRQGHGEVDRPRYRYAALFSYYAARAEQLEKGRWRLAEADAFGDPAEADRRLSDRRSTDRDSRRSGSSRRDYAQAADVDATPVDLTIYRTKSGVCFHTGECKHLQYSKIELTHAEAKRRGLTACKICKPPEKPPVTRR